MKNPFKAIAKVVTVPTHVVQNGVRLVRLEQAASDALNLLEEAAAHPELYRSPTWWERALIAAQRVFQLIPLPDEGRHAMKNWKTSLAGILGYVVLGIKLLAIAGIVPTDPKVPAPTFTAEDAAVGTVSTGLLASKDHDK